VQRIVLADLIKLQAKGRQAAIHINATHGSFTVWDDNRTTQTDISSEQKCVFLTQKYIHNTKKFRVELTP